jgi:hypothetical protein
VRDWLRDHPDPQPDHYFITGLPSASRKDPTSPMTAETIRHTMETLKERTHDRDDVVTVKKPCHPHMMRHNFVSMCRRHPDVTDADIKFYIGHNAGSDVMETTYSHLSSEDHNARGHQAFGTDDAGTTDEDDPDPWDTTCARCDRVLAPGDDTCAECGTDRRDTPWTDTPDPDETTLREAVVDVLEELQGDAEGSGTTGHGDVAEQLLPDASLREELSDDLE